MASAAAVKPMDVDSDDEKDQIIYQDNDNTLTIDIRKNSYGPIFYLTFTFTKEIHGFKGDVVTTIWNYKGRPESDKIELALVKINEDYQGISLCKPMVMYCMKKTIQYYITVKGRNPKFVQIDVVSRMPERAVNCYVSVLSALGLIQMQSEKEKDETSWINHYIDYTFPKKWNPSWLREEVLLLHESDRYFELEKPPSLKDELTAAAKQGGRRKRRRKTKRRKRRKKKTRKKRGRGKCVSKPKYYDEEEIEKRIAQSIEHMNIQAEKLEEIIKASTCDDGTVDLNKMLKNITKHQEQKGGKRKRKKKSRRRK